MLEVLLNSAKPMIKSLIKEKCKEKLAKGENSFNIGVNDLEKLLLDQLGINFLNIYILDDNGHNYLELEINEEIINGK